MGCADPSEIFCALIILRETSGRGKATAKIPNKHFSSVAKLSDRGVRAALQGLREKGFTTGRQGEFSVNYEDSEWELEEKPPQRPRALGIVPVAKRPVVKPPEPAQEAVEPEVETVWAKCLACGIESEHAHGCTGSKLIDEEDDDESEEEAKEATGCHSEAAQSESEMATGCRPEVDQPSVLSDLDPSHDPLVAYLAKYWVPVFQNAPTGAQLAAIRAALGDSPVHCFAARCEHRRQWLEAGGRGYSHLVLMARDSRSGWLLLKNANVRSISREDQADANATAAAIEAVEEAVVCGVCKLKAYYPSEKRCRSAPCLKLAQKRGAP